MARVSEEGIVHVKGTVPWEDIARVRIEQHVYAGVSMVSAIKVKSAAFTGSIHPSSKDGQRVVDLIKAHMPLERIEVAEIGVVDLVLMGVPLVVRDLLGSQYGFPLALGLLLYRRRRRRARTIVDTLILAEVILFGIMFAFRALQWVVDL